MISNNCKAIMKFIFTVVIFDYWIKQTTAKDNDIFFKYPNQTNCQDNIISLNFSNTIISNIGAYFISSPLIACLNFTNNDIQFVARDAFKNLPNLTYLILSKNNLRSNNLFNFGGHEKLNILNLNDAVMQSEGGIIKIVEDYPNLEFLYARNNGFEDMQYSVQGISNSYHNSYYISQKILFPKLKVLDLSGNGIEKTNFIKLLSNQLQFLDLHKNNLRSINFEEKGKNLIILNLDNNKIENVEYYRTFYYYSSLALGYLKNLRYLSISENDINTIDSTSFRDNNKLSYLNLSRNNIHEVHADTFAKLYSLRTLDLSFNLLQNIPQVSDKINISNLFLNNNKIKKIIPNAFAQTPKLTKLSLEYNKIYEIDAEAFANLFILEMLDLSNNKLNSLPEEWTKSLVSLKYLDLSSNMFISLESLSLTSALPLIKLYLVRNSLEYLNVEYFESLPQNLTVNLIHSFNFTKIPLKNKYYEDYEDNIYNIEDDYDI